MFSSVTDVSISGFSCLLGAGIGCMKVTFFGAGIVNFGNASGLGGSGLRANGLTGASSCFANGLLVTRGFSLEDCAKSKKLMAELRRTSNDFYPLKGKCDVCV